MEIRSTLYTPETVVTLIIRDDTTGAEVYNSVVDPTLEVTIDVVNSYWRYDFTPIPGHAYTACFYDAGDCFTQVILSEQETIEHAKQSDLDLILPSNVVSKSSTGAYELIQGYDASKEKKRVYVFQENSNTVNVCNTYNYGYTEQVLACDSVVPSFLRNDTGYLFAGDPFYFMAKVTGGTASLCKVNVDDLTDIGGYTPVVLSFVPARIMHDLNNGKLYLYDQYGYIEVHSDVDGSLIDSHDLAIEFNDNNGTVGVEMDITPDGAYLFAPHLIDNGDSTTTSTIQRINTATWERETFFTCRENNPSGVCQSVRMFGSDLLYMLDTPQTIYRLNPATGTLYSTYTLPAAYTESNSTCPCVREDGVFLAPVVEGANRQALIFLKDISSDHKFSMVICGNLPIDCGTGLRSILNKDSFVHILTTDTNPNPSIHSQIISYATLFNDVANDVYTRSSQASVDTIDVNLDTVLAAIQNGTYGLAQLKILLDAISTAVGSGESAGDTSVDHNTNTDGTHLDDAMRVLDSNNAGIDEVKIIAYLKTDYDLSQTSPGYVKGSSMTKADGRWERAINLNSGFTYTIVFYAPERIETTTVEVTI